MNKLIRVITTLFIVTLTARLGTVDYAGHRETWYNLPMKRIVERANGHFGCQDVYAVREDGVKTYNGFVICAADWERYPYGSTVETTLGIGLVLDKHTTNSDVVDIATDW